MGREAADLRHLLQPLSDAKLYRGRPVSLLLLGKPLVAVPMQPALPLGAAALPGPGRLI